jgi:hypothetical protein
MTKTQDIREHDVVVDAAWMVPGAYDVRDNLYVTG